MSQLPEYGGELPVAALAEEMLEPGEGQVRALITVAGNPVLSTNGRKLEQALDGLEFMLSVDFYINETTRYADVILPPTAPLEHDHYDATFNLLAVRNVTRFNLPVLPKPEARCMTGKSLSAGRGLRRAGGRRAQADHAAADDGPGAAPWALW